MSNNKKQPDQLLIDSMAMRYRHDFGLLTFEEQQSIRVTMTQLWEEVVGLGFYKPKHTQMSNNKQSMKLYTEEQVREALILCELSVCGSIPILSEDDIIRELTPIKLPSDEEIEEESLNSDFDETFRKGAKWMRDKIQGGDK